jgi:hypothetical protein
MGKLQFKEEESVTTDKGWIGKSSLTGSFFLSKGCLVKLHLPSHHDEVRKQYLRLTTIQKSQSNIIAALEPCWSVEPLLRPAGLAPSNRSPLLDFVQTSMGRNICWFSFFPQSKGVSVVSDNY